MTDAQTALAQVREALAAGPTPGPWFAVNDGTRGEPFMNVKAERIGGRGPTHEVAICATGDSPQSMETANARLIAACSPANVAAILAHVEAQAAEIERLTAERDEARAERDALANVLPGVYYMDPPDGGDVPVLEQLRRMSRDAARYRFLACKGVPPHSPRWSRWRLEYWNGEWWGPLMKEELDAAIDAQIEQERRDD